MVLRQPRQFAGEWADRAAASAADQQKRQNALLRRLCEANAPEKEDVAEPTVAGKAKGEDEFIRPVAER